MKVLEKGVFKINDPCGANNANNRNRKFLYEFNPFSTSKFKMEYEVEKILDSRINKVTSDKQFLVKWVSEYDEVDITWEPK